MKKPAFEPLDLLRKLGDEYRHVEQEHHRKPPSRGATRHRLAEQMRALEAHFDRDHRRRDIERHFAAVIAEEAAAIWRRYPTCELIVVASPVMLGLLRPAIGRQIRAKDQIAIHEVASDHTKLSAPMLHDLLAESELLPERGRRAPILPTPGLPT